MFSTGRQATVIRELLPAERLLYQSDSVAVGSFRARPEQPGFGGNTPCTSWCFVFPRTSVWIRHEGRAPFVADPTVVTFYNRDCVYERRRISAEGDKGDWFAISPEIARDAVRARDPHVEDRPDLPFRFDHGPGDSRVYLEQRAIFESLSRGDGDDWRVDEAVIGLLDRALDRAYSVRRRTARTVQRRDPDLADAARERISADPSSRWSLGRLAASLHVSPYHLCHSFRQARGSTLGAYRTRLRVLQSLERVVAGDSLTDLAFDLGFSSHSHFTTSFRCVFGIRPSDVRGLSGRRVRDVVSAAEPGR